MQLKANPKIGPSLNIDLNVSAGDTTSVEESTENTEGTTDTEGIAGLFDRLSSFSETGGTTDTEGIAGLFDRLSSFSETGGTENNTGNKTESNSGSSLECCDHHQLTA